METTTMVTVTADAIEAALREYIYPHYGLRVLDELPEDGETLSPSRVWDDGEPTDEHLDGTSVIRLGRSTDIGRALKLARIYQGRYIVLVGADKCGEDFRADEGEDVFVDPVVLERWTID